MTKVNMKVKKSKLKIVKQKDTGTTQILKAISALDLKIEKTKLGLELSISESERRTSDRIEDLAIRTAKGFATMESKEGSEERQREVIVLIESLENKILGAFRDDGKSKDNQIIEIKKTVENYAERFDLKIIKLRKELKIPEEDYNFVS